MATRIYGINVGETEFNVTEGVGSPTATKNIEVTVDLSSTLVGNESTGRQPDKEEVLRALDYIRNHIIKDASGRWG